MKNKGLLFLLLLGGAFLSLAAGKAAKLVNPIIGKVTSGFGNRPDPINKGQTEFHNGVDIPAKLNTVTKSPWDGKVAKVFYTERAGNQLIISHDNGYKTGYAHLNSILVKEGQTVKAGQAIALTGATGKVTGPHLHFTVTDPDGNKVDPQKLFSFK